MISSDPKPFRFPLSSFFPFPFSFSFRLFGKSFDHGKDSLCVARGVQPNYLSVHLHLHLLLLEDVYGI